MSEFSRELQATAALNYPGSLDAFSQNIPMEWVTEAIKETGRATGRKRRFPAEQAVWLVLGIGLMRNRSINDVCDKLDLAFPDAKGELPPLASSSLSKARHRLGIEPLRHLFHTTATEWEKEETTYSTWGPVEEPSKMTSNVTCRFNELIYCLFFPLHPPESVAV
ncbi:transposase domain-containing protein [Xenorhabdus indica]|uniref:transposase domain-containing protein n=2 Tax=Xenorhabdus TaxID=626 RepID=UPI0021D4E79F|nr:transposase domain-containing protein [Xenorhabdus indica]